MPAHVTLALIVARPGPLRDSLQALITTLPQLEIVAEASDPSALLRMGDSIRPDIVLLDASLPEGEVWPALKQIQEEWAETRTIVLVRDSQQQRRAVKAGAHVALLEGFPAARLAAVVETLLSQAHADREDAHSRSGAPLTDSQS